MSSSMRFTLRRHTVSRDQSLQNRSTLWGHRFTTLPSDELPYDILHSIRRRVLAEETLILEEDPAMILSRRTAPEKVIARLTSEKFDGFEGEELGDCCICYEELNEEEKEVSRIRCGHVYQRSCILTWVQRKPSCPLCRRKIE